MNKQQMPISDTSVSPTCIKPNVVGSTVNSDCSRHTKKVAGITDMKVLAEMIGDLHYETLTDLLKELFLKVGVDARKDLNGGRIKLGCKLLDAEVKLCSAYLEIKEAWAISKPFMSERK